VRKEAGDAKRWHGRTGREERYSLEGTIMEFPNPGKIVIFQGMPFHFNDDGRTLQAFTDEERLKFNLKHRT